MADIFAQHLRKLRWRGMVIRSLVILGPVLFWLARPGIPAPAAATLEQPDTFELLSIDPRPMGTKLSGSAFHDYPILGKTTVTDPAEQHRISRSIRWGARLYFVPKMFGLACFSPRHGVRITRGQSTTDFVICFHCGHIEVHADQPQDWNFDICGFPESTFDEILQKAGISLAPKEK